MHKNIIKNSKITVCVFGRQIDTLYSDKNAPDYEENSFNILNYENDHELNDIIKKYNPHAYISFGDWQQYKLLNNAPFEIRKKWMNYPMTVSLEKLGEDILKCYINSTWFYNKFDLDNPLISVFTPAHKSAQKIFRPLQSLLDQTYKNWEWIIVDDSDDNDVTFNLLKEISEIDHRIKVFKKSRKSGSIGELKRWAVGLCSGEYLCELDHDDELTNKCLEYIVKTFLKYPDVGFAYTDSTEVYEEDGTCVIYNEGFSYGYGSYRKESYKGKVYDVVNGPKINPKTIRHIVGIPNHVRVWKKDIYFKTNGHNPNLHVCDDYDLIIKTFLVTRIAYIPKLGYIQYRNKEGNTTFERNKEIQRLTRIIKNIYDVQINDRFCKLNINDFLYDKETKTSNLDIPNPTLEEHCCIISDVD